MVDDKKSLLQEKVKSLPLLPGVYRFYDSEGNIIYIGKAKFLKKRVSSYFVQSNNTSFKIRSMIRKISDISHIVVDSESDALLLENNLIKQYKPRYNSLLKDDKTYPWIVVTNEEFPRVFFSRNKNHGSARYFGPFTSKKMVNVLLELFKRIYKVRTCKLDMTKDTVAEGKHKVCLEYHIKNCLGPCVGKQSYEDYNSSIKEIVSILKGNIPSLISDLKNRMKEFASNYMFEEAQTMKDKILALEGYQSKSTIVSPTIHNIDVFGYYSTDKVFCVNYLKIVNGSIVQSHNTFVELKFLTEIEDVIKRSVVAIRDIFKSTSKEIIVADRIDISGLNAGFVIPKIGDKKKLLELSERNAKYYYNDYLIAKEGKRKDKSEIVLDRLKRDLNMDVLPKHIECFDNSNIQGAFPVAACVVFKNGKPSKSDYRHFNVKTVVGPDDFASMYEILHRRYSRLLAEDEPLPQLIIIDGGKGQLGMAVKVLNELNILHRVTVVGIAKRLEEIFFPGDPIPLYIDKTSSSLKIIQHLRNEAHRFGITFHRNQRSKNFVDSTLLSIPGVGGKTADKLLSHFGSVAMIKKASVEDLAALIGQSKANTIYEKIKKL
jgi:excinuclease ABC subunit C